MSGDCPRCHGWTVIHPCHRVLGGGGDQDNKNRCPVVTHNRLRWGKSQLCGGRDGRNAEWGRVAGGGCGTWPTSIWRVCRVVMSSKSFTSQDNKVKGKESCRLHGCCLHGCRTMIGYLNEKC